MALASSIYTIKVNGKISDSDESWTVVPEKWKKLSKIGTQYLEVPSPQGWAGLPTPGRYDYCSLVS